MSVEKITRQFCDICQITYTIHVSILCDGVTVNIKKVTELHRCKLQPEAQQLLYHPFFESSLRSFIIVEFA
jgi:hypothetical protein